MGDLSGRCVLVTGAAGGLGTELCLQLVARGASVLAIDADEAKRDALASIARERGSEPRSGVTAQAAADARVSSADARAQGFGSSASGGAPSPLDLTGEKDSPQSAEAATAQRLTGAPTPAERHEDRGHLHIIAFDQSDPAQVAAFVGEVSAKHGAPDTLINNAAIYPKAAAETVDLGEFEAVQRINVVAHTAFMQAVAPAMKASGFGRIVNVASITFDLGFQELSAYVASKAALIGLTKVWARELGPHGITVNAISPGAFQTDAEKIHPDPEGYSRFVIDQQAVKRRGTPADFAHLVLFLIAGDSSFITGQNLRVDGGWVMT